MGWERELARVGNWQKKAAARVLWRVNDVYVVRWVDCHRPGGTLLNLKSRGKERVGRRARVRARAR